MMQTPRSPSRRRTLCGATAMIITGLSGTAAWSQVPSATTPSGIRPDAGTQAPNTQNGNTAGNTENITVRAQRRLLREKDAPSAVTELGAAQISQTSVGGSVATLLRAAPSVNVYQQGIGNNSPVLTIRGVRGLEVAQTLDGVPMQDLLSGGSGSYLSGLLGAHFNLDQISGVSVYPGVAYPDKSTFGTIGGTVAYDSLRPDKKAGADLFGSVGSFGTWNEGFDVNSGRMNGILGTGLDAPTMMLKYSNLQTSGFVDYTPARYNNMSFAFDKPYNDAQSLFQATVNYNTGSGLITPEPLPLPYTQQNGRFSNYSPGQQFQRQYNDYFTMILKNDTYINDYISAGVTGSYLYSDTYSSTYGNPTIFAPNGEAGSVGVGGANPFNQTIAGFGQQSGYGMGTSNYVPGVYTLDPNPLTNCPASTTAQFAAAGQKSPCGFNSSYQSTHSDTYILQPRVTITPPRVFGIDNTIKVGALIAKEIEPYAPNGSIAAGQQYYGSTSEFSHTPANLTSGYDGGVQRTIYEGYAQDKIDLLNNTLHITPGVTLQTSDTSLRGSEVLGGTPSAENAGAAYGAYKIHKWDRTWLPFLNAAYDLDKILPAARGVSLYASYATSSIFAPVQDYGVNSAAGGAPPNASIVHMYEAGVKYNRNNLSLSIDYFYQHVERDFGFFQDQTPSSPTYLQELYSNAGQREMKGFEAAAIYQVTPHWQVFGNVSYTLAKYLKSYNASVTVQEDQFGLAIRGAPITGVPDWVSTFGVAYNHHNIALHDDELNVRFEGQYTGKQQTTIDGNGFVNLGPLQGNPATFGSYAYYNATTGQTFYNPNGGISPFAIFNLDVNYRLPVHNAGPLTYVDFDLNVLNIFNTKYFQYFYNQVSPSSCSTFASGPFKGKPINPYGCSQAFNDALPGEPAAITFSVRAHF